MSRVVHYLIFFLVASLVGCQAMESPEENKCEEPADIAFAIDSSRSIWILHFIDQIEFVQKLTKLFNIGPGDDQVHVAALTFSDNVAIEFNFNENSTAQEVYDKTGGIEHAQGGYTFTDDALERVREDLFSPSNGARSWVKKICILLTDGASTYPGDTLEQAKLVKEAGITIIAIGIGNGVNKDELESIVTQPASDHFYYVNNFEELEENLQGIGLMACEALKTTTTTSTTTTTTTTTTTSTSTTTTPTTTTTQSTTESTSVTTPSEQSDQPQEVCKGKRQDIIFVVDMSTSIWGPDFEDQLKFLNNLTASFDIDSGATRVGMITFSDAPELQFNLNSYSTKEEIQKVILDVKQKNGLTNTHLALQDVQEKMMRPEAGFRPDVDHTIILFTDGISKVPEKTASVSNILHEEGVNVIAIGVGRDVDVNELNAIASKPEFVFEVGGYDMLEKIRDILAVTTCEGLRDEPDCKGLKDVIAFSAFVGSNLIAKAGSIVSFDTVVYNINKGYNPSTGVFTAPKAGWYRFAFSTKLLWKSDDVNVRLQMKDDESMYFPGNSVKDKYTVHSEDVAVVRLELGEEIWVRVDSPGENDGELMKDFTTFSGVFLHD